MSNPPATRSENRFLVAIFAAALLFNLYGIAYHWTIGFMSGHEFRQTQTAIVSYYIDQQNNFSLLYETPILGKPWVSILLEVPIYEWSVVLLSRATGLPHVVAARTISAGCFYLMLPALWLLLGRLAVPKPRRLLMLALVLMAPVYIYYSRAFLMDSMALMCSAWWLLGFVRTMDERRWGWLFVTIVAGTLSALIKSAIFAVWLMPGAAYGAWMVWRDLRARSGWGAPIRTICWGAATVVVALGALQAWIAYTDPIKAAHASAWIFTSKNLSVISWGLFDYKVLFTATLWRTLMACWEQAMMSRWLIGVGLGVGLALSSVRWRVLGVGGFFFVAQLMFPFAYAYQDYYFYTCAVFLHIALGFALLGVLDSRLPRWVVALVFAVPFVAQVKTYWQGYRVGQSIVHHGGFPFTEALRDLTPKNSVIIVAGADWAAITPLYAQRKALMIRNGLEYERAYLERAFKDLADEEVSAFVVYNDLRTNKEFTAMVAGHFDMDATPTFSYSNADIYVSRTLAGEVAFRLREQRQYGITPYANTGPDITSKDLVKFAPQEAERIFVNCRPAPYQAEFRFGIGWMTAGNKSVLSSHPNTDLWIKPPQNAKTIEWSYGIFPGAYEKPKDHTDGVEFIVYGERPGGRSRRIYWRLLDPARNEADRSEQSEVIPYTPLQGESLRFSTRPFENPSFDWAYTVRINVK